MDDNDMPSMPRRIPRRVSVTLGYLHNQLAHTSGESVSFGVFIFAGAFVSTGLWAGLNSFGTHEGVVHFCIAAFCTGDRSSLGSECAALT
jgi:hypothetical protein